MAAQAEADESEVATRRRWRMPRALPRLQGRWLIAFNILWLLLLPLAAAMPIVSTVAQVQRADSPIWMPLGLLVDSSGDEVRVDGPATEEARAAGVREGDVVVAIDGRRVRGGARGYSEIRPLLLRPAGTGFAVSLRGADGRLRAVRLTRSQAHTDEPLKGSGLSTQAVSITTTITTNTSQATTGTMAGNSQGTVTNAQGRPGG